MPKSVLCVLVAVVIFAQVTLLPSPAHAQDHGPDVTGNNAIVIDAESGAILYDKDANERVAPASLTKIFTAFFAIEATPLQRRMAVEKDDLVGEASAGLNAGDSFSLETLLHGLLLASGNDAAMTIARNVGNTYAPSGLNGVSSFSDYSNSELADLGLAGTNLVNPHGLDEPGHVSTARDVAAITMHALKTEPDFLRILGAPDYSAEDMSYGQRNQLFGNYPGILGGKTGITDDAGYCLMAIAHREGRTIISVVMGSTPDDWYYDSMALLDYGFATPVQSSMPVITLQQQAQSSNVTFASAGVQGLAMQAPGAEGVSVRPALEAPGNAWHIVRWPLGAFLFMLVALVCVVQLRAFRELQQRPRAAGMRPRRQRQTRVRTSTSSTFTPTHNRQADETQPFTPLRPWEAPGRSWSPSVGD